MDLHTVFSRYIYDLEDLRDEVALKGEYLIESELEALEELCKRHKFTCKCGPGWGWFLTVEPPLLFDRKRNCKSSIYLHEDLTKYKKYNPELINAIQTHLWNIETVISYIEENFNITPLYDIRISRVGVEA